MPITSKSNNHLKEVRSLARAGARARTGRFVAEGEDLYTAACAAGVEALYVLCAPGLARERAGWHEVNAALLAQTSGLGSGARVVAVFEQRWAAVVGPLVVALWGVADPGNVGAVVRSAHAFGASCVALGPGCADPYGPKAVRASMGTIFSIPLARIENIADLPGEVVGLAPDASEVLAGPVLGPLSLLVGAEREGLPEAVLAGCTRVCRIAQVAGDSLNAAMAATVALYEVTRMAAQ